MEMGWHVHTSFQTVELPLELPFSEALKGVSTNYVSVAFTPGPLHFSLRFRSNTVPAYHGTLLDAGLIDEVFSYVHSLQLL